MELYTYSAAVTVLTVFLLFGLAFRVGLARGKGKVKTYETYTTKDKDFIIATRIHLNTLENVVIFLPLLWVATLYASPLWAAVVGVAWLLARVAFAYLYKLDPKKRAPAFMLSVACLFALAVLSVYGLVQVCLA